MDEQTNERTNEIDVQEWIVITRNYISMLLLYPVLRAKLIYTLISKWTKKMETIDFECYKMNWNWISF